MRTSRSTLRQTQAILCGQLSRHVYCGLAKTHTTCRNFGPIHATSMLHYCAVGCSMHVKKTVKEAQARLLFIHWQIAISMPYLLLFNIIVMN